MKSVDQRTLESENPCRNRVCMCVELGCKIPFWRINAEDHYEEYHKEISRDQIPAAVKLSKKEIDLYEKSGNAFKTSTFIKQGKKRKRSKKSNNRKKQRVEILKADT